MRTSVAGGGPATPWRNLIVEGDNFDALRYLRMAYSGRVKCIYIDPPYNTGNKDFVYNDSYVDRNDLWRHSKWVEFMYRRLQLARDLLAEDGVIFVSIDDNELFALGLLMNKVFGEANFVGTMVWKNATDNNPTNISVEHEYILCFAQRKDALQPVWKASEIAVKERLIELGSNFVRKYSDPSERQQAYSKWLRKNKWQLWPFQDYKFIDDHGIYTGSRSVHNPGKEGYRYDVIHPETGKPCSEPMMGYRFPPETMDRLLEDGRIIFGEDENKIIELKLYAADYKAKLPSLIEMDGRMGANELKEIFAPSPQPFRFPKPSELLKELITFSTTEEDLIVDFFAGSGTTAHATLKLNLDGGNRRFILVSNTEATEDEPDKNLCRDVCAERVRRVIQGYGDKPGTGGDFAYLRCRRIAPGRLMTIEHEQVWTALQLIHTGRLTPWKGAKNAIQQLLMDEATGAGLIYVPKYRRNLAEPLREIVRSFAPGAICYSWQPELIRVHVRANQVQHEGIPESLARRFGIGKRRAKR